MAANAIDQQKFREVLSHFPTGVAVITATTDLGPVGMTLQSFMSLSLDPALILLAVDRKSTTWPKLADGRSLTVNVLAEHQARLARQFAKSGGDKFSGVVLQASDRTVNPLLADTLAWFDCEIVDEYDGGDHIVAICAIRDFGVSEPCYDDPKPLLFFRSDFPKLAGAQHV